MGDKKTKNIFSVIIVCVLWYNFSTFANVLGKRLMNDFPYPVTITIVQLIVTIIYLKPIFYVFHIPYQRDCHRITKSLFFKFICPLALGKFISTACAHVSIWKVSISYAHTVKATMPLFTIILARLFLKEKQTAQVYASLIPIIFGVLLASVTEFDFNSIGLIFALLSTFVFALMNIFSKKLLNETKIHHLSLLYLLSSVAIVLFLPFWFYSDFKGLAQNRIKLLNGGNFDKILLYLFLNTSCNFGQNMLAFTLLSMIAPLSYSVANVTKRIWVISLSLIFMGNKTSVLNVLGMTLAIFGIFLYHRAKYQSRLKKGTKEDLANGSILPLYHENSISDPTTHKGENGFYLGQNNFYNAPAARNINGNILFDDFNYGANPTGNVHMQNQFRLTSVLSQGDLSEI